jgi:hypothetical protein
MKSKMMEDFEKMLKFARQVLKQYLGESQINQLLDESRREYLALIPQLPYIGGKKNSGTANLVGAAQPLAIIRPLEGEGLALRTIGQVVYETMKLFFESKPRLLRWLMGKSMTTKFFIKQKKKQTENSVFRRYPGAFVTEFVEGDSENFDFGLNVIECAICKFYKEQEAEEYVPYLCLLDYPMFGSLKVGFSRTQTIGNGAPLCDFRFKKGGSTRQAWPPEKLKEFKQIPDKQTSQNTVSG